ncbi:VOC family protein [Allorhizobium sp. BGMRC 0089]|nr:VOC family protein [Allorhizobium sonneratiae]MCM2291584.1 VOC family protein [Allorhizobium sonneratiae]
MPVETVLETALYAADLDAAEGFYGGVIGLTKVRREDHRHVFYRCGEGMVLIFNPAETVKPAPAGALPVPSHGAKGQGHICFCVAEADMDTLAERLKAAGIAIEADFFWPNGARSLYVRDPAGNSVEFSQKRLWGIDTDEA